MRWSPIVAEQADRVRLAQKHRRALLIGSTGVAVLAISSVLLTSTVPRNKQPEYLAALAWVAGRSGAATGVAVDDSTVQTDARTLPVIGDTVAVSFWTEAGALELVGIIGSVTWATADSAGATLIRLAGGGITPRGLPLVGAPADGNEPVVVACIGDDGAPVTKELPFERVNRSETLTELPACGPGTVVLDRAGGVVGTFNLTGGRNARLVFIAWTALGQTR